jgi:carboxypeptidase Taq
MEAQAQLNELRRHLHDVGDINAAIAVLSWDQTTYMPDGGGPARGRQLSTLGRLAHEHATDPQIGRLLEALEGRAGVDPDSDDAALVRVARRNYDRLTRIPADFMAELYQHNASAYETWARARPDNDFAQVRPVLEKTLEMSRRLADFFPGYEHIADPLIDLSDYGMRAGSVRALFAELRSQLVPLVQAVTAQPPADDSVLKQHYPERDQLAFGERVIAAFGYDFERGRQDKTLHPYCTTFSIGDVRITTRIREDDVGDGLFGTLHEAGHAMYEQGVNPAYEGSPLAGGTSAGVHESQSRLWENLVGRSLAFWQHFYPQLQAAFPEQLGRVPLDTFYRAVNKIQRSLIRVEADELTYNLHVIIRFDLELELLEGALAVRDLPEAWRARYQSDIGIAPPNYRDGVLQDVHWYAGLVGGAFQGYTIGNILSAQFYDAALRAHPGIAGEISQGQFGTLHSWLREHIYQYGSKYTAPELIERATGGPLQIAPYIRYLREKYGTLYQLG